VRPASASSPPCSRRDTPLSLPCSRRDTPFFWDCVLPFVLMTGSREELKGRYLSVCAL
jgi:hypothetical protein